MLINYRWPGNIRQLKNITEQISIIEQEREIDTEKLIHYLPDDQGKNLPTLFANVNREEFSTEREILYKILFDMRNEINELKTVVKQVIKTGSKPDGHKDIPVSSQMNENFSQDIFEEDAIQNNNSYFEDVTYKSAMRIEDMEEMTEESLSLQNLETEMIKKALEKHKGKRKYAAQDLGISERTLYRKIKEYDLE